MWFVANSEDEAMTKMFETIKWCKFLQATVSIFISHLPFFFAADIKYAYI